jgi:signal peptidase I
MRSFPILVFVTTTLFFFFPASTRAGCADAPFFVRGSSLAPFIPDGAAVQGRLGADCGDPARGDLVLFKHLGFQISLLKIVVGVPGDRFDLREDGEMWSLIVNGVAALNAEGKPYQFSKGRTGMLRLFLKGTQGVIPQNAWLALGDSPSGSDDSTRFGLIPRADIIGIVPRGNVPASVRSPAM